MPADNVEIVNRALTLLGEYEIASLSDQDSISLAANRLYEPVIVSLFGKHAWRFARTRVALTEDTGNAPINQWTRAFLLPTLNTDRIGAPIAFYSVSDINSSPIDHYELVGARVETNETALWCRYTKRVSETLWPESFAMVAVNAVAAVLAMPVTQKDKLAAFYNEVAFGPPSMQGRGGKYLEAYQEDTWSDPVESLMEYSDPLREARNG